VNAVHPSDALTDRPAAARALRAWVTLRRAANALTTVLETALDAEGLTESQFGVLEALRHLGPLHPCDLAKKILRTTGNLTLVLDQLERRGLVRRERGTTDRRFITVHLTDEGLALIDRVFPAHADRVAELFDEFMPEALERFGDDCKRLGLRAASRIATPAAEGAAR
jgi:MarR family 2-MHQ and catechol resistance regulon transcriptional repressor